ncbi:uncharacterized protein C8A04DRAFT_28693 [Dichotomopilus funicola]|uniref:Carrier domain-containing protein n=1 Tax=Dichotomopilus funicola TaxID=1934379 RepID=A0AAN6V442_9PEZI|nr:hypothetical protein C8A04DRAFT_28693 [Dichotomopilus funicola]
MAPPFHNILDVLVRAAQNSPDKGLLIYPSGQSKATKPQQLTYASLLQEAAALSQVVANIPSVTPESIILIHLDSHLHNVLWLWATIAAGLVPAISTPFTNDLEQRKKHLLHLNGVLQEPIVITRQGLVSDFAVAEGAMKIHTIEELGKQKQPLTEPVQPSSDCPRGFSKAGEDLFALMLTSGSTGHAKAVSLRHGQVVEALLGKASFHETTSRDVFLNWIGMDHVANLTEIHLHAMSLGADQVHVHAVDLLAQPMTFLRLIDRHRASYTFAPNFFLASVRKALEAFAPSVSEPLPDLRSLRALISGGEANPTALATAFSDLLAPLGAQRHFLRPGFGMTETCAGSIYGKQCPTFDIAHAREFTSLGQCIPCMDMRVSRAGVGVVQTAGEVGILEVKGPNVFKGYYNNPEATASSFSEDGWFITGDLAFLDDGGNLHLVGREKETIIINGVKYFPHEIEGALEDANIPGVTPSFTAVFPHRPKGADSETLCVVYLPSYNAQDDADARLAARNAIRDVVMKHCMTRPYKIIPLERVFLPKTALGKLSRSKLRAAFEAGIYADAIQLDEQLLATAQGPLINPVTTPDEILLQQIFADVFNVPAEEIGTDTNIYNLGCTSVEIFRLKWALQTHPSGIFPPSIPVTTLLTNPTITSLLTTLIKPSSPSPSIASYNPVVTLRTSTSSNPPLWLIHPGIGEILIFLHLAQHLPDRPIYALRARGFDGEPLFGSIPEMAETYLAAVRRVQPTGPYALLGYSFGGTVAYEMGKLLSNGTQQGELGFLGVLDQPPHIKERMRHGGWGDVLLTLARFFDLLPDQEREAAFVDAVEKFGQGDEASEELVEMLLGLMEMEKLDEFGLDRDRLARWTSLALNSHVIGRDYEPDGQPGRVPFLEVFYGDPITAVAKDKKEWREVKLSRWEGLIDDVQFHEVRGHHYTLLAPENVASFAKTLTARLKARGV